jgi:hypothetical protein
LLVWLAKRSSLPTLLPSLSDFPQLSSADDVLQNVQRRAYRTLHETCGDCSGAKVDKLWRPILRAVAAYQPAIPIFTLNYDWTFEKLAVEKGTQYQLIDGFQPLGGEWKPNRFTNVKIDSAKTVIALFKLHGSTCWLPGAPTKIMAKFDEDWERDSQFPPHQFEMVYPAHAKESWFGKDVWQNLSDPRGMFESWAHREPYKTLYGFFHEAIERADLIVIVGYAFGDDEINAEILAALKKHPAQRVLVFDPGVREFDGESESPFAYLTYDPEHDWSRFQWLKGRFGNDRDVKKAIELIRNSLDR